MDIICTNPKSIKPVIERLKETGEFVYVGKSRTYGVDILALYHTKGEEGADDAYKMAKGIVKGKDKIDDVYEVNCYPQYFARTGLKQSMEIMNSAMKYLMLNQDEHDKRPALDREKSFTATIRCR